MFQYILISDIYIIVSRFLLLLAADFLPIFPPLLLFVVIEWLILMNRNRKSRYQQIFMSQFESFFLCPNSIFVSLSLSLYNTNTSFTDLE